MSAAEGLAHRARWRWPEIVFWLVALGAIAAPAGRHLILNEIAILALFALSLDWAMPASSRWAMPPSSASAPTPRA
jgi:hypothetical protein